MILEKQKNKGKQTQDVIREVGSLPLSALPLLFNNVANVVSFGGNPPLAVVETVTGGSSILRATYPERTG